MKTWIALFRGINMIGRHRVPMKELVLLLEGLGAHEVKTYHQSGNAVFRYEGKDAVWLSARIGASIRDQYGFEPRVIMLEKVELERIIANNPYPEAVSEPELCVFFLSDVPDHPDLGAMEVVKIEEERFELCHKVLYLHTPEGTYRSKVAGRVERSLGVPATARTWRTVERIAEMVHGIKQT